MIHKFSFKNFYSFKEENEVSFIVNENAPKTDAYFNADSNIRLNKTLALIGSNASGKTNLLKVLSFIQWFIVHSFSDKPDNDILIDPFVFDDNSKKSPCELFVEFQIENKIYKYFIKLNSKKIFEEELSVKGQKGFNKLFKRYWDDESSKYILDDKKYGLPKDFKKMIRPNASIISTAKQIDHEASSIIYDYWQNIKTNVGPYGRINSEIDDYLFNTAKFFYNNPKLKEKAEKLLIKFDLGLSGIKILKDETVDKEGKKDTVYVPFGVHGNNRILFFNESRGTQNLFVLLKMILTALATGSVIVLDEFDADLHPHMVPALIELFSSKVYNPKNAQILFSTHAIQILSKLDKYQILLTEKDEDGVCEAFRLDEVEGVRSDDNYYTKYISGAYGAIPNI